MTKGIGKTTLASQDIEELAQYLRAEAGLTVALRFIDEAERSFAQLAHMPRMGAVLDLPSMPVIIRKWHITGFPRILILYHALPDGIEVVRVIDAGRDIAALFPDPAPTPGTH
jgi:toxin ParE1/3/4